MKKKTSNQQCKKCKHKGDKCWCPKDKECTAFEEEVRAVKRYFSFFVPEGWKPNVTGCFRDCPIRSVMFNHCCCIIRDGDICPLVEGWSAMNDEVKRRKAMFNGNMIIDFMNLREGIRHLRFVIGETLVEESKMHITQDEAFEKIKQSLMEFDEKYKCLYEN